MEAARGPHSGGKTWATDGRGHKERREAKLGRPEGEGETTRPHRAVPEHRGRRRSKVGGEQGTRRRVTAKKKRGFCNGE